MRAVLQAVTAVHAVLQAVTAVAVSFARANAARFHPQGWRAGGRNMYATLL